MSSDIVCVYHANCYDGVCAAWVMKRWAKENEASIEFIEGQYGDDSLMNKIKEKLTATNLLVMVDFSMKRAQMEELAQLTEHRFAVLDHHKSAQEECKGLFYCDFDMNESGASLCWKTYFTPSNHVPMLIRYIKDRDLWRHIEIDSNIVHAYIQSYPITIDSMELLYNELETSNGMAAAKQAGMAIERFKEAKIELICKNAYVLPNGVPTVNSGLFQSEVGHRLCQLHPNANYSMSWYDNLVLHKRIISLRSIGTEERHDVSKVAKSFGGGGHFNAAGYEIQLLNWRFELDKMVK